MPSMLRIVFGTWRRMLPSPVRLVRGALSPRRWLRRFRLRWVLVFSAACVVWLIATLTESAGPETALGNQAPARLAAIQEDGPDPPPQTTPAVPASPEAASRFFRKVGRAVQAGFRTGHIRLTVTETEATSALDIGAKLVEIQQLMSSLTPEELEALDTPEEIRRALHARDAAPPDGLLGRIRYALSPRLRFRDGQIRFLRDGRIVVSGYAQAWSRRLSVYMDAVPTLEAGRLRLEFRETRLGRLPVPSWVLGGPANMVTSLLGLGKDYARLDALDVGDGRLSLSGRVELPRSGS